MVGFSGSSLKILIIEDNQHFRLLIRTILNTLGVKEIEEAKDGFDALRLLHVFKADIVIADWKMEPMDGLTFVHKVRRSSESPSPFVPIIMVTGYSDERLMAEARDAGVNEFLSKPITAKSLVSRLVSVIERPRPFVRTDTFFGPDRRRQQAPFEGPDRRKAEPTVAAVLAGDVEGEPGQ